MKIEAFLTEAWPREGKNGLGEVFLKLFGPWSSLGIAQKSNFSAAIPSAMNGLLQRFDEALIALGPAKGGLQEATTTLLNIECSR